MKIIRLISILGTIPFLSFSMNAGAENTEVIHRVVGYLPDWNYQSYKNIDFSALTNINIAFCNPNIKGILSCDIPDNDLSKIVSRAHENNADVFAALGGASSCEVYLQFIDTPEKMAEFDKNIIAYCLKYKLDGIDLDIELGSHHQIWSYYKDWCFDLRKLCDDNNLKMSTATAHWVAEKVAPETFAMFDFINVMAYDNDEDESSHSSYEYAVDCLSYFHNEKNIPSDKLVLGVPFYGRGYNAQGELDWNSYESFATIVSMEEANYNRDFYNGIAYNGAETIAKKSSLGKEYGGIMIWELTQDCKGDKSLLKVINDSLNINFSVEGDINGDNAFNSADLVALNRFLLGYKNTNIVNWKAGNLCEDNTLNLYDLIAMRKLIISISE